MRAKFLIKLSIFSSLWCLGDTCPAKESRPDKIICPTSPPKLIPISRKDVYNNTPFKNGEIEEYKVSYMGVHIGYGRLIVKSPVNYKGKWNMQFFISAKTGDWYKAIFVAKDKITAVSRPQDFGALKFYIEQNEGKIFSKRYRRKKWLVFDQEHCKVKEKTQQPGEKPKSEEYDVAYGSMDTLGASYWIRTNKYKLNVKVRKQVFSSGKTWWLEAIPLAFEEVEVPAGKFKTVKLQLKTYIGYKFQQKGDVYVWIDIGTKYKPMVKLGGKIALGTVYFELNKFIPGH